MNKYYLFHKKEKLLKNIIIKLLDYNLKNYDVNNQKIFLDKNNNLL